MRYRKIEEWIPSDNLQLEDNALNTVKSDYNTLVIAGPGAGKTELLAQRASFLLETNSCIYPRKILAISFKRDAAYNLKNRVDKRCGEKLSKRFDSLTFDAFSKVILDQFYRGLPKGYKINYPYDVILDEKEILEIYKAIDIQFHNTHDRNKILEFHNSALLVNNDGKQKKMRVQVWQKLLESKSSKLSFKMIMRLSQLIIVSNPKIMDFLQETYSHIFLDEFQDTTFLQFEFLNSCFGNSNAIFTAVGDDKQRIMLWAGAKPDIFDTYIKNYKAKDLILEMNFRSAPRLVELQNHLISKLLNKSDLVKSSDKWNKEEGEAFVWVYDNQQKETEHLFKEVKRWIENEDITPRDICILVKQQLGVYAGEIIDFFNQNGIKARDENQLQDLLSDDLIVFVLNTITLLSDTKSLDEKTQAINFLINTSSVYEDDEIMKLENKFNKFIRQLINKDLDPKELVNEIIKFVSIDRIKANFPNYRNPKFLKDMLNKLSESLGKYKEESENVYEAVQKLLGKDSVPIMTIHKSKGLEYNSIIFVGLEDGAFWSFEKQPDEDKCAFFVALSRAKERVAFTYSKTRKDKWDNLRNQDFKKIRVIFDELQNSGLVEFKHIVD
ncbi:UvrD-helicase domain-containing protein [Saccharicrinis fermentans]|uniref:DNA 3'-5' helicase n=1 Tax=Saccharicrinis fermentans DSM 9555 = JCM 21142 TaxID=869213 RepID=W7YDN2_9BACT|nr:ATP-dependent helicase [Saccharicrinis fermentans]GAF05573.1 DNA helicase II [Saccharicrinis fermentans DSM 9555 = JCM 21142]